MSLPCREMHIIFNTRLWNDPTLSTRVNASLKLKRMTPGVVLLFQYMFMIIGRIPICKLWNDGASIINRMAQREGRRVTVTVLNEGKFKVKGPGDADSAQDQFQICGKSERRLPLVSSFHQTFTSQALWHWESFLVLPFLLRTLILLT